MPEPICPVCTHLAHQDWFEFTAHPLAVCEEHAWDGHGLWREHAERQYNDDTFAALWAWACDANNLKE